MCVTSATQKAIKPALGEGGLREMADRNWSIYKLAAVLGENDDWYWALRRQLGTPEHRALTSVK